MVISEDRNISTCCRAFYIGVVTFNFNDLGKLRLEFEQLIFRMRGERSNRMRHRGDNKIK